jgi:FkbM family methyltransferase
MSTLGQAQKIFIRATANRLGVEVTRHPYGVRLVRLLKLLGAETLLDIGANEGQYGRYLRSSGFEGQLISLEPLSAAFAKLSKRAAGDPRWDVERLAASDHSGSITINVAANSVSSSVLPMRPLHEATDPNSAYTSQEEVQTKTVDELIRNRNLNPARMHLKLDVQGLESVVLDGATEALSSVPSVELELSLVELYEGEALMTDLIERMSGTGFDLWILQPGFWDPETSRTLQCDAVFVSREASASLKPAQR